MLDFVGSDETGIGRMYVVVRDWEPIHVLEGWIKLVRMRSALGDYAFEADLRYVGPMRLSIRNVFFALLSIGFTLLFRAVMQDWVMHSEVGAAVAVGLAIITAYLLLLLLDLSLWKPLGKEHARPGRLL